MSKILLIHNSDKYFDKLQPPDNKRPNFYWYTDRFVSHIGTSRYIYIFLVNPKEDGVELRCRTKPFNFDAMHKDWLHYRDYKEGKLKNIKYAESGIAMSFSELIPTIVLRSTGNEDDTKKIDYEIIKPSKRFGKKVKVRLFKEHYKEIYTDNPIKFSDIAELAELIPDIKNVLPFKHLATSSNGLYSYDSWLPMSIRDNGTWL